VDPCRLVRQVKEFGGENVDSIPTALDPCRLVRPVKESTAVSALELLHRPDEAAGVEMTRRRVR
jgi:hypothetical protein